ncbi:amino acid permease [Kitasatospora paracochleata]|uniref:APA family basic amino acid/polyamine antiporter n=1 Tax=Kitasatospora paracochleata TaxID=58354 RepID=A0ABT1IX81_9ACTN|nr:amino acid permease [Kitasatospora paracochleata]MCP2309523.1 APA family basic amino acid/polyamine antiporter [Kitasatospora paracochleata]
MSAHGRGESPQRTADDRPSEKSGGFGLPAATALVVGSIIGTGVFALPSALAPYGPIALVAFVLVTIGALALAVTFGRLSERAPGSGGPYVYARDAFGEFAGFLTAWSYWITAWAGNAAIAVAWVGYVEVFVNKGHHTAGSIAIALVGLWLPALVNLTGVRAIGAFQIVTTVLKFLPLAFMATIGLLFMKSGNFGAFNAGGTSPVGAISAAGAIALFSYIGLETASVAAGRVRDPRRNVPRATIYGTLACAAIYLLGTLAVLGTVPHSELGSSTAPFTDAVNNIAGGHWAGNLVAAAAIVSGIGALNGWTLICAEMPMAAARDGLFPDVFTKVRGRGGVPAFGIVSATVLASVLTVVSYTRFTRVFTEIVLLSVLTAVIPYLLAAAAQLYRLVQRSSEETDRRRLARDVVVTVVALAFCYWSIQGSGYQTVYYGLFTILLGIPVYIWLKRPRTGAATDAATRTPVVGIGPARDDDPLPKAARTADTVGLPTILRRALTPRHQH